MFGYANVRLWGVTCVLCARADFTKEQLVRKVKDLRAKAKEQAAGAAAAAAQANTVRATARITRSPYPCSLVST